MAFVNPHGPVPSGNSLCAPQGGDSRTGAVAGGDVFAQVLMRRANDLALLTRHATNTFVAVVALVGSTSSATPVGMCLMAALGGWGVYRISTRSPRRVFIAIDCMFVLAICTATPLLSASFEPVPYSSLQTAVVSATMIGFAVALPLRASVPVNALILAAYAWGFASIIGWQSIATMASLHYVTIMAVMGVLLRVSLLRVAAATERAHETYLAADEMRERVAVAARDYEQEQLALLHDVGSTLLLVGNATPIPPDRLAAQATCALRLVSGQVSANAPQRVKLVAALHELPGTRTPVQLHGSPSLWLNGELGMAITAATGAVLNNVDRHADATRVSIDVSDRRLVIKDDGCGFTPTWTRGHGIAQSIVGRMERVGGTATIHSAPGHGTAVEFSWPDEASSGGSPISVIDAGRLVKRVRRRYRYASIGWALLALILTVPSSLRADANPAAQIGMAALAALGCLAALSSTLGSRRAIRWICIITLMFLAVAQPMFLPANLLCTTAQWSLWTTGWCLSPLLLGRPLPVAMSVIVPPTS